jgi:hypothetical protein
MVRTEARCYDPKGDKPMSTWNHKARIAMLVGVVALGCLIGMTGGPGHSVQAMAKLERHPHIRHALAELKEARVELKEAAHDFGGHRKAALEAVEVAIRQLNVCLKHDK